MFSIITPAHNNPDTLKKFLVSVKKCASVYGRPVEIIVVDDNSTPSLKSVTDEFDGVVYVRMDEHAGPARARNEGARKSKGDYLIFADSDVIFRDDILGRFSEDFSRGEYAVVGEYDIEPAVDSFFARFKALLTESWVPSEKYVSVFALRIAGIKREVFDKAGGFNEDIKTASVEDYEFADRLKKTDVKILYNPDVIVKHHHPGFMKQMRLFFLRSSDWMELCIKREGRIDNWCASSWEGISSVSGFFLAASLIIAVMAGNIIFYALAAAALLIYIAANARFLKVVYRRRGLLFLPVALLVKLPLACMITLGSLRGLIKSVAGKITIRRHRNRTA